MAELALVVVAATLVNNLTMVQSLGVGSLIRGTQRLDDAVAVSLATGAVIMTTAAATLPLERYVLLPLDVPYLRLIAFALTVVFAARGLATAIRRLGSSTRTARVDADLLTANGAVLGVALLNVTAGRSFIAAACYAFGAALGFGLVLVQFAGIPERLARADVPGPFRGHAITFVTAGIVSLAFLGFAGFARL